MTAAYEHLKRVSATNSTVERAGKDVRRCELQLPIRIKKDSDE